jgi:hypothetical protein
MSSLNRVAIIRTIAILLIIFGGIALRVSYNANTIILEPVRADAAYNLKYAHNLLEYGTFSKDITAPPVPDSYWAPGFPFYLAAVIEASQLLGVDTYNLILTSQMLLGAGTIFICFMLSATFLPGYWPLLPPALVALSPHLVSTASYVLTETLFGFLLLLSLYALSRALASHRTYHWLLAGICFAATYFVNPVSLLLPPLLGMALILCKSGKPEQSPARANARNLILLMAPVLIAMTLWSARTAISVPPDQSTASKRLLTNLVIGMYPDYHQKWRDSILKPEQNIKVPGQGVDKSYGTFFKVLVDNFSRDPLGMLIWYSIEKPVLLWSWDIRTGFGGIYIYRVEQSLYHTSKAAIVTYSLMHTLHTWLLIGCILGIGYLLTRKQPQSVMPALLYLTLLYVSAVYVISQSEPRYSIPLRPELYICATFFLWRFTQSVHRIRQQRTSN